MSKMFKDFRQFFMYHIMTVLVERNYYITDPDLLHLGSDKAIKEKYDGEEEHFYYYCYYCEDTIGSNDTDTVINHGKSCYENYLKSEDE